MLDLIFCLRLNFSSNQLHTSTTFLFFKFSNIFFGKIWMKRAGDKSPSSRSFIELAMSFILSAWFFRICLFCSLLSIIFSPFSGPNVGRRPPGAGRWQPIHWLFLLSLSLSLLYPSRCCGFVALNLSSAASGSRRRAWFHRRTDGYRVFLFLLTYFVLFSEFLSRMDECSPMATRPTVDFLLISIYLTLLSVLSAFPDLIGWCFFSRFNNIGSLTLTYRIFI